MAMGVYSAEELESALEAAGCTKTDTTTETSTIWLNKDGRAFQVPLPYQGYYPDWMLYEVYEFTGVSPIPWFKGAL